MGWVVHNVDLNQYLEKTSHLGGNRIWYLKRDSLDRATGAFAIMREILNLGTKTPKKWKPLGFVRNVTERSHLLGGQFAGRNFLSNLVILPIDANQITMVELIETPLRNAIEQGEIFVYSAKSQYNKRNTTFIPNFLEIEARGTFGTLLTCKIRMKPSDYV